MSPEEIVEKAASLGVILFNDSGKLSFYGQIPSGWIELTKSWLLQKPSILSYLENPPWAHRVRLAKAQVAASKNRLNLPCIYLGELINPKPACGCGALHKCEKYGEAVLTGTNNKYRVCSKCNDYATREAT